MIKALRNPLNMIFADATGWLWLFALAANILLLATPIYTLQIYSNVLPAQSLETLIFLTGLVFVALGVYGAIETVKGIIAQKLSARFELMVSHSLLEGGLNHRDGLEIAEAMRDVAVVRQTIANKSVLSLFDVPFAPLFVGVLCLVHPLLGLVTAAGAAVLVVIAWRNNAALGDSGQRGAEHSTRASRFAAAGLSQSEDVRAMGMAPEMIQRWETEAVAASVHADRAGRVNALYFGLSRFTRQALQGLVMCTGAVLVINGQLAAGAIFAAALLSGRALQPIEQIIGGWRSLQSGLAGYGRLGRLIEKLEAEFANRPVALPEPAGRLVLEQAGYGVDGAEGLRMLLRDIDLEIEPGSIVAIMGPSGAGKSTLARLLAGIVAPTEGHVRLDGFDLGNWQGRQRGGATGYLGQDSKLLDGTVAENIARYQSDATDRAIVDAAMRANAHEFIARLPQGYNTVLGANGVALSGGQAQRIGLARALFGAPRILILDEPNAHLDDEGEVALKSALVAERMRGRTIAVVSQRSSILDIADFIARVDEGQLVSFTANSRAFQNHANDGYQLGRRVRQSRKLVPVNGGAA